MTTVAGVCHWGRGESPAAEVDSVAEFRPVLDYLMGKNDQEIVTQQSVRQPLPSLRWPGSASVPMQLPMIRTTRLRRSRLSTGAFMLDKTIRSAPDPVFKDRRLVGASEIGDYAADDINNLPVID